MLSSSQDPGVLGLRGWLRAFETSGTTTSHPKDLNPCSLSVLSSVHILTYSVVQSPSWEANWFAASQEITRISRNPNVHYRTHKRPPVSILGQPNPVHIPTSHLLEIRPNIIHLSTSRCPQWSLSAPVSPPRSYTPPLLTHTRHMPSPSHSATVHILFKIRMSKLHSPSRTISVLCMYCCRTYHNKDTKIVSNLILAALLLHCLPYCIPAHYLLSLYDCCIKYS